MDTCKTCCHWLGGACNRIEVAERSNKRDRAFIEVQVDDDSNLRATLRTRPDFGCVLHEPEPRF